MEADAGDWINVVPIEAREILHKLALAWNDVAAPESLEVVPLKVEEGTASNKVYEIKWKTDNLQEGKDGEVTHRKVLLRIYAEGTKHLFNREDEIRMVEAVSRQGQGPRLLGTFANGRVEEFLHGRPLKAKDLRDQDTTAIIAKKLREFHDLEMPGPKEVILWDRLKNWLEVVKRLSSPEEDKEFCLNMIEEEIISLENELSSEDKRIGFCHNDLWYGNMMMDDDTKQLTIIVSIQLHLILQTTFARWLLIMIRLKSFLSWTLIDIQILMNGKRFVQIYLSSTGEEENFYEKYGVTKEDLENFDDKDDDLLDDDQSPSVL